MKYIACYITAMLLSVQSLAQEGKPLPPKACVLTQTGQFHILPQHNVLAFTIYDDNGEQLVFSIPLNPNKGQEEEDTLKDNETQL